MTARRDQGLAIERTSLSWARTFLGVTGNGALVILRHDRSVDVGWIVVMLVLVSVTALGTVGVAAHRSSALADALRGSLRVVSATAFVWLLATAVTIICLTWTVAVIASVG